MQAVVILASEAGGEKSLWYPTILGILVFLAGIAMFIGTVYLLLATNLGARLGFLITAAALSGFMLLLSLLWLTNAFPLTTLKGRIPQWVAVEKLEGGDVARSDIGVVQRVEQEGRKVDPGEEANLKAALDAVLVTGGTGEGEAPAGAEEFATFESASDFLLTEAFEVGGGGRVSVTTQSGFPWLAVSFHKPRYAVAFVCPVDKAALDVPFGDPIPAPTCDRAQPTDVVVFERDLGSLRVPPLVVLIASSILFGLSLLALHWRELEEREVREEAAGAGGPPVPVTP